MVPIYIISYRIVLHCIKIWEIPLSTQKREEARNVVTLQGKQVVEKKKGAGGGAVGGIPSNQESIVQ